MMPVSYKFHICALSLLGPICLSAYLSIHLYTLTCEEVVPEMIPLWQRFHMCALSLSSPIYLSTYLSIYPSICTFSPVRMWSLR